MAEITHADQLQKAEFRKLIREPKTWYWIIGFAAIAGIASALIWSPALGPFVAVAAVAIGVGMVHSTASNKAEQAFYAAYAESRGFERSDKQLGPATPLLRKGDKRTTNERFVGQLSPQFEGSLALWTYTEVTRDSKGRKQETHYRFTIVLIKLPDVASRLTEMVVERNDGMGLFDKLEDAFKGKLERLTLESEALDDRFEIFIREDQDPNWVRQLFSPSFIVWLTEHPTRDFAFEFGKGKLVAFIPGHRESTAEFEKVISDACELAGKLQAEAVEA